MRLSVILALLVPSLLFGQSTIPKAVTETVNLSPRCKKGDLQTYEYSIETRYLNEDATPKSQRKDVVAYSQYCASNTPERGVEYKITIDSFAVGTNETMTQTIARNQSVKQLDGYPISSRITRTLPVKGGCYDTELNFPDSLHYVEIYEFTEYYRYLRLLEQLRFSAGIKLSKVGDTAVVAFPAPICYSIEQVIDSFHLDLAPQVLELTGLTSLGKRACALVTIKPSTSPFRVYMWTGTEATFVTVGSLTISGTFLVALDDGDILKASILDRSDAIITVPGGKSGPNRRLRGFTLRQTN